MSVTPRVSTTGMRMIRDFPSPGQSLGDMTLPDGNTGLDTIPSVPSAWARLAGVQIRVAFGHACSPYRCCKGLALLGSQGLALHWPFCKPTHSMRGFLTSFLLTHTVSDWVLSSTPARSSFS